MPPAVKTHAFAALIVVAFVAGLAVGSATGFDGLPTSFTGWVVLAVFFVGLMAADDRVEARLLRLEAPAATAVFSAAAAAAAVGVLVGPSLDALSTPLPVVPVAAGAALFTAAYAIGWRDGAAVEKLSKLSPVIRATRVAAGLGLGWLLLDLGLPDGSPDGVVVTRWLGAITAASTMALAAVRAQTVRLQIAEDAPAKAGRSTREIAYEFVVACFLGAMVSAAV